MMKNLLHPQREGLLPIQLVAAFGTTTAEEGARHHETFTAPNGQRPLIASTTNRTAKGTDETQDENTFITTHSLDTGPWHQRAPVGTIQRQTESPPSRPKNLKSHKPDSKPRTLVSSVQTPTKPSSERGNHECGQECQRKSITP